jgi:hypothetical protein
VKIVFLFMLILLLNACEEEDNYIKLNQTYSFSNASNRSSAYVENNKIAIKKNNTFLLILNNNNKVFKLNIVHLVDNKIKTIKFIDDVIDNHGGGSIFINSENKICVVYGGHLGHLKYRCSKKSLDVSSFDNYKIIDKNKLNIYQTYPSVIYDNNITYLVYREENIEKNIRNPKIVLVKINDNGVENKKYIYKSNSYYSNFTASIVKKLNYIDILYMRYGVKHDRLTKFNGGVFLARSNDNGKTFNTLSIVESDNNISEHNYYNSNLTECNDKLYFVVVDYKDNNKNLVLYEIDRNNTIIHNNLSLKNSILNLISKGLYPNVRPSIECNSNNELYLALPFKKVSENSWNALSNKVYLFKINSISYETVLVFMEKNRSWLVNIEKNSNGIPSILYNNPDTNQTIYKYFKKRNQNVKKNN